METKDVLEKIAKILKVAETMLILKEIAEKGKDEKLNMLLNIGEVVRATEFVINSPEKEILLFRSASLQRLVSEIVSNENLSNDLILSLLGEVVSKMNGLPGDLYEKVYGESVYDFILKKLFEESCGDEVFVEFFDTHKTHFSPKALLHIKDTAVLHGDILLAENIANVAGVEISSKERSETYANAEDESIFFDSLERESCAEMEVEKLAIEFQKTGIWKED